MIAVSPFCMFAMPASGEEVPVAIFCISAFTYIRNYEPGPQLQLAIDLEKSFTRQGMGDSHLEPRLQEELCDRLVDPHELHNVVDEDAYHEIRETYAELLHTHLIATHDPIEQEPLKPAPRRSRTTDPLPSVPLPNWV